MKTILELSFAVCGLLWLAFLWVAVIIDEEDGKDDQ
jgi:hypothetical protein